MTIAKSSNIRCQIMNDNEWYIQIKEDSKSNFQLSMLLHKPKITGCYIDCNLTNEVIEVLKCTIGYNSLEFLEIDMQYDLNLTINYNSNIKQLRLFGLNDANKLHKLLAIFSNIDCISLDQGGVSVEAFIYASTVRTNTELHTTDVDYTIDFIEKSLLINNCFKTTVVHTENNIIDQQLAELAKKYPRNIVIKEKF